MRDFAELKTEVAELKTEVAELKTSQERDHQTVLSAILIESKSTHDKGAEVAIYLKEASRVMYVGKEFMTTHYLTYQGYVFGVGVLHSFGSPSDLVSKKAFSCSPIDAVIIAGCPDKYIQVINASQSVPLRMGDAASTFGFVNYSGNMIDRYWSGFLSGKLGDTGKIGDGVDSPRALPHEYIFQGVSQVEGMSGGPTVNGCGYTGMAHARESRSYIVPNALVIPAQDILNCAMHYRSHLSVLGNCPESKIARSPFVRLANCK